VPVLSLWLELQQTLVELQQTLNLSFRK